MAPITLFKRAAGRAHMTPVVEGTDSITADSVVRTTSGVASLWDDSSVTAITAGTGTSLTSLTVGGGARSTAGSGHTLALNAGDAGVAANAGGAASLSGGVGNTSGAGGAANVTGGQGGATGNGGDITIVSGAGGGTSGNSGNLSIDSGAVTSGTTGTVTVGGTNASALNLGNSSAVATLTGAGVNLAGGSSEIDLTTTGAVDINSAAGTWDSTAGLSFDAAGASNFSTSSGDMTVSATGGSTIISGGEAVADAVQITAANAAGGIDINAGGTSGAVTIDGGGSCTITTAGINLAAGSSEIDLTTTGALDLNSGAFTLDCSTAAITPTSTFDVQATGNITMDSSGGTIGIGTDADTGTINIGTSASARTINIGSSSSTAVNIAGTGVVTTILGDLVVSGTTTSVDSETVNISDNHLYLNNGYTTVSAQTGGLVVNYLPTAVTSAVGTGGFTASVAATSNPTVKVGSTTGFAANDYIQVSGANLAANDGLYEVLSVVDATTLKIRNVNGGEGSPQNDFTQDEFTTDATVAGSVTKVNVSVMRAGSDGAWETGSGSSGTMTFTDLATASGVTLQTAYQTGNTISMSDAEGNFDVSVGSGTPAISLDAAGASNFTVAGAALTLSTTTSGAIDVTSAGILDLDSAGALSINSSGGVINVGDDAVAQGINIGTGSAARSIAIGNTTGATSMNMQTGTGGILLNSLGGNFSINGDTSSTVSVNASGQSMTVEAIGGGAQQLVLQSAGTGTNAVDINATAGGIEIDSAGVLELNSSGGVISVGNDAVAQAINVGTGAAARTITIGNNTGATTVALEGGSGGIDMHTVGDSVWSLYDLDISLDEVPTAGSQTAGNSFNVDAGVGSAADISFAGAVGGPITVTGGTGGAASASNNDAAAGGTVTITGGTGGAGATAQSSGGGGDVLIVGGSVGAAGGGTASTDHGRVAFTSGTTQYFLTAAGVGPALTTTAQTIIEAINEVQAGAASADTVTITAIATTGLTVGRACYISAADTASHTDANATATSEVIGFVSTVGAAGSAGIVTGGLVNVAMVAGLNVSAGDVLYLGNPSVAGLAGQITNDVSSFATGDTIYEVGVANSANASTTSDALIEMVVRLGQRIVV